MGNQAGTILRLSCNPVFGEQVHHEPMTAYDYVGDQSDNFRTWMRRDFESCHSNAGRLES
jgi:hypothetical protein